jgi:hypothetical protein
MQMPWQKVFLHVLKRMKLSLHISRYQWKTKFFNVGRSWARQYPWQSSFSYCIDKVGRINFASSFRSRWSVAIVFIFFLNFLNLKCRYSSLFCKNKLHLKISQLFRLSLVKCFQFCNLTREYNTSPFSFGEILPLKHLKFLLYVNLF